MPKIPEQNGVSVEYDHQVPLRTVRDRDGLAITIVTPVGQLAPVASVPVLLGADGDAVFTVFVDGDFDVWFKICKDTTGRATFGSNPVPAGEKEVFELDPGGPNYISFIARAPTTCTVNTYPRGT